MKSFSGYIAVQDLKQIDILEGIFANILTSVKKGISKFITELKKLVKERKKDKKLSEKIRLAKELDEIILNNVNQKVARMLHSSKSYPGYLKKVQGKKIDPLEAAEKISNSIIK